MNELGLGISVAANYGIAAYFGEFFSAHPEQSGVIALLLFYVPILLGITGTLVLINNERSSTRTQKRL